MIRWLDKGFMKILGEVITGEKVKLESNRWVGCRYVICSLRKIIHDVVRKETNDLVDKWTWNEVND